MPKLRVSKKYRARLRSAFKKKTTAVVPQRGYRHLRSLGPLGFPKVLKVKHKYVEAGITHSCTAGALATYIFRANGMYDPNATTVGHQPMHFDQMTALYNHWTVIGSRCRIKVHPAAVGTTPSVAVLWIDDDATTTMTSVAAICEQAKGNKYLNISGISNTENTYFNRKWSAKKTFPGSTLANDSLKGTASADPTEQSYYKFSFQTVDLTNCTIYFTVEIEYIAVWRELKELAQS